MTAEGEAEETSEPSFSIEVGKRLRSVRRIRGLSLDDVERESGGKWSASPASGSSASARRAPCS